MSKKDVALEKPVIEHLPEKKHQDIPSEEFDELIEKLLEENEAVLKRLSDDEYYKNG